ncbi:MAG: hypothetical protein A3F78_20450 [Burkholderiales bacterium RIFCSPLOWO2_12_FULL_61_40]|nr:MAG: hypothetical protein A3F78_20450 [Burkholderiales bacterium RIFCSPLOWO2_12_FULL_61_40]
MSDAETSTQSSGLSAVTGVGDSTAGAMLRSAREAAGLHIAALAVSMKVPVKKLEALESDQLDLLLDVVFARALASSMCRALKIDPTPVLEKLPQNSLPKLHSIEQGINAPFRVPGQRSGLSVPAFLAKPGVLLVMVLLLGVLTLAVFPDIQIRGQSSEVDRNTAAEPAVSVPEVVATPALVLPQTVAVEPAPAVPAGPVRSVVPAVQGSNGLVADVVKTPQIVSDAVGKSDGRGVSSEAGSVLQKVLLFKAKAPSWLEVTDANGIVQIRRTLSAGESVGVTGALPLSVVIGRADAVEVEVRGKAFSLANIARDNVARFEVK